MNPPVDRVLLDYAQDKIAVVDRDGTYQYLNRAAKSILGYDPDDLVGENAFGYMHPSDRDHVRARFEETITVDDEFVDVTVEYRHRQRGGGWVWLESRMSNLTDSELGGYVVSTRDISDRIAAERERDQTETRLRELAANTDDVLWMFSGDWSELLFLNPAYESVYGGSIDAVEADVDAFIDRVYPEDVPAVRRSMAALSRGESVDMEYRVNPGENYNRWVWVQAEPIVEDGEVVRIVGFTRDVTDRNRRERQLAVVDNLLRHNIRNDMTTILGQAELIADDPEVDAPERAAVIRRVGEALLQTTEKQRETLHLFRSPACPTTVDVADAVDAALASVRVRYPAATIETTLADGLVASALSEVEVALSELIENAVKHADSDAPTVRISGRVRDDEVEIRIDDDCPPLPEFEYRVLTGDKPMSDVYHSTGLGLWLVYWIVDLSDGRVEFVTSDETGNTITVVLPRAPAPTPE